MALLVATLACTEGATSPPKNTHIADGNARSRLAQDKGPCGNSVDAPDPHLSQFFSPHPWEWREAAIWIAHAAPSSLDRLECTPDVNRVDIAPRVIELI